MEICIVHTALRLDTGGHNDSDPHAQPPPVPLHSRSGICRKYLNNEFYHKFTATDKSRMPYMGPLSPYTAKLVKAITMRCGSTTGQTGRRSRTLLINHPFCCFTEESFRAIGNQISMWFPGYVRSFFSYHSKSVSSINTYPEPGSHSL